MGTHADIVSERNQSVVEGPLKCKPLRSKGGKSENAVAMCEEGLEMARRLGQEKGEEVRYVECDARDAQWGNIMLDVVSLARHCCDSAGRNDDGISADYRLSTRYRINVLCCQRKTKGDDVFVPYSEFSFHYEQESCVDVC